MTTTPSISIQKETLPFLNIAMHLNAIPFIPLLLIKNNDESHASGQLEISIHAEIACIEPFSYNIENIAAGGQIKIPTAQIKVNRAFFSQLSEAEQTTIYITIKQKGADIVNDQFTVALHPLEHFGGFQVLPELIASYVTPNHSYVYHIKRKVVEIMQQNSYRTAFEGYQANSAERVIEIMSAIYSAIQNEQIVYSAMPPGYEETGQRLRLLTTIQQEKFANCIDLSLLFAACLEAVDLNPVLIIVKGHAFVGCWLNDDKFPEIINDDKTAITKRLSKGIREMAAVEATSVCKGNNIKFTDALNLGEARLVEKEDFLLSVDIKAARSAHVRPLPLMHDADGLRLHEEVDENGNTNIDDTFELGTVYNDGLLHTNQPKTKQKVWERKLLDLSLRNNLLNLRITRNMLQLVDIDISHLEDTLSEGKSFTISSSATAQKQGKYNVFEQPLHASSPLYQNASNELKYSRLLTYYHQQDLDSILTYIHKNAKQAIEENGSSTLYLAVGLLKWFDQKTPSQPRYAPILLLPVEISRRSVNSKFSLKSREEETMVNITLLEFLRQEYQLNLGALEQLPTDEKGVDVPKVMATLRHAVMQLKGWDVENQLVLGNFSFSKLILWKDIVVHQEALLKSDMVRSLVEGKLVTTNQSETITSTDIDSIPSQTLALPIATDVSQMEAVLAAQNGQNFILHGPPGTGKSQTITNIIADALYHGKRVLFVAAKKAALDVVYKRMEQIGLAPFSLELHSNKSKKSDILEQLAHSLETTKTNTSTDFLQEAKRLDAAKATISQYVNLLHQQQPVGWSLYQSIAALEDYKHNNFSKNFIQATVLQQLDKQLWQQWTDWLPHFQSAAQLVVHPAENPLAALQLPQYSPALQQEIADKTQQLLDVLPQFNQQLQALSTAIYFPYEVKSNADINQFVLIAQALKALPDIPFRLIQFLCNKENVSLYEDWSHDFGQYQSAQKNILSAHNRSILTADITAIEMQWRQALQTWFLPKWFKKRKLKKQLSVYRNSPFTNDNEVEELFTLSNQYKETQRLAQQSRFSEVQQVLRNLYKDEQTDLTDIGLKTNLALRLGNLLQHWGNNAFNQWITALVAKNLVYSDELKQPNISIIDAVIQQSANINTQLKNYENLTGITVQPFNNWITEISNQLKNLQLHLPKLKDWMNYVQIRKQGIAMQLQWLINAFENRHCAMADLENYFHYTVHTSLAQWIITGHEQLSLFNASLFESKVEQYKKIAKDFQQLTIQELRVKLSAQLPNTSLEAMQSSEIGILQRAIKNRGRGMSIRKLFDQIPTLLPRIAPWMLMSPISAAQYFDVDTRHFDLVIFDEASQLPTCEAVSALARAKQAIVVGDPKQMPPTSFFTTNKVDEENMEVEDLESILDDCLSLSIPSKYLLRHYRSKHESLIAFSNTNYYDNKLLTFPSADDLNRKVQYHYVPGHYDKGKTRTNTFEADAIVAFIKQHYTSKNKLSLGVVTFSQTQQSLVEDKLDALFATDATLEQTITEGAEPLFIKNLENVQGDERDIILFSIGYAPDEIGKMTMNFGPLNRSGGWRRLNVAVTRARYEMHVFATLHADQIDLSRSAAEGVAGLKAFLQFAEKGQLAINAETAVKTAQTSHLPDVICQQLQAKGLVVKCHIGTSGFKIDVGIVHPNKPGQYILGIVIDGLYYFNARTANDREMVMPTVLKSLGWHIFRIWTMDWYENSAAIIDSILKKVQELQNQPDQTEQTPIIETIAPATFEPLKSMVIETAPIITTKQKPYVAYTPAPVPNASSETIYEFTHRNRIKQQLQMLINTEAPISKGLLYKKLLQSWNTARVGTRLDKHLEGILSEMDLTQTQHHQLFYWAQGNQPKQLDHYRSNDTEKRNLEDIAPEELLVALHEVVSNNLSIEEDELLRYLARAFGFAKVGKQIETLLRYTIDIAEQKGIVRREDGRVKIVANQ